MISSLKNKISSPRNRSSSRSRNNTNEKPLRIETKMSHKTNGKREDPMIGNLEKLKLDNQAEPINMHNYHTHNEIDAREVGRFADEPEYRMNHSRRGVALLINNKHFDSRQGMPARDGTDKDAASLESTLNKLGFDIKLVHNCSAHMMRDLLFKLARADHSNYDCFLCVIMTHGDEGVVYGVDKPIEIEQLIQPFKHNRTLTGKPKMFFIQACRGSSFMEGVDSNPFEANYVNKIPMEADFLLAYSTIAGYYSWRNSTNGSWFIQSLCHVLNEHGRQKELMQLLTAVNRRVAYYYESNTNDPEMSGKRQIPCIVSMLTKEVYFKPKSLQTRI